MTPTTRKTNLMMKMINTSLIDLPTPTNLPIWWNFGSLLGICLLTQTITGLFLAMHYTADTSLAFSSVAHICRDINNGWLLRNLHANGASLFFICIFMHAGRGLYYGSFMLKTWNTGITLLLLTMATAFVGYVLPWGQMSLWGATVITNLLSAIPHVGTNLVQWIWGGFSVDTPTLTRFFTFHFILPFMTMAITMLHLLLLHETGSSNPTGLNSNMDKTTFHTMFSFKDILGFLILLTLLTLMATLLPNALGDPDNFSTANPMTTPTHIKPEWYFLFAYAILRSVPNKLGGIMVMALSISLLFTSPTLHLSNQRTLMFRPLSKMAFWAFTANALILTWIGGQPVEPPFIMISQISSLFYFITFVSPTTFSRLENHHPTMKYQTP